MKGVSQIIATILVLMITIGLAGTAFIYIQSALTGRAGKNIDVLDASCSLTAPATDALIITVKNFDPKELIPVGQISFFVRGTPRTATWDNGALNISSGDFETARILCSQWDAAIGCTSGDVYSVKAIGPSNSITHDVVC